MVSLLVDSAARACLSPSRPRELRRLLRRMIRAASLCEGSARELVVAIRLTDDAAMRALNRAYRQADRATDVLAFPQRGGVGAEFHPEVLGDILISVETARRQARGELVDEILFLAAHGLCHLLGYDHQTDEEEATMNERQRRLLTEARRRGPTRAA